MIGSPGDVGHERTLRPSICGLGSIDNGYCLVFLPPGFLDNSNEKRNSGCNDGQLYHVKL